MEKPIWMSTQGSEPRPVRGKRLKEHLEREGFKEVPAPPKPEKELRNPYGR